MAHRARNDDPDEVLMLRFQHGDVGAFEQIVSRQKTQLYSFILHSVREKNIADALLHDVFLAIAKRASEYKPEYKHEAHFLSWFYSIARDLCVASREGSQEDSQEDSQKRKSEDSDNAAGSDPARDDSVQPVAGVDPAALRRELKDLLDSVLAELPDDQREVFLLREMVNLPFKEIAIITDAPESFVKTRMRLALSRFRTVLQSHEEGASS